MLLINLTPLCRVTKMLWLPLLLAVVTACSQLRPVPAINPAVTTQAEPAANLPLTLAQQQQFDQGRRLLQQGEVDTALALFSALFIDVPQAPGIGYNLALSQWQSGDVMQAQQTLAKLIQATPNYLAAHNLAGVLARQQGDFRLAQQHYQQVLKVDEGNATAHKNLAFLYELYLDNPAQARNHYQRYYDLTQDEQAKIWLALLQQQEQADAQN
ncbi:tetratricopeptide repeat protein [Rheinheimera maricola]|uniref:Tetratricopeptide repeat protein n=1 Tax=Rheinheimera maricola TaxID=2793282 RepID=A0ABS7X3C8_9GAMM|nr:tetratricopeptide repeat protein [Rheinheimera maricola]MBZ9610066.1 tetratricopeptide repeat protein [Rheinheimera maricola]